MSQKRQNRDDTAALTAKIHGVTADYVRKIIRGDRKNKQIKATYDQLKSGKNKLIKAIEEKVSL